MKLPFSLLLLSLSIIAHAQYYQASVQEDYSIRVQKVNQPLAIDRNNRATFKQLENFPKRFLGDSNSKNFRNVTLADIDQDGVEEILFAAFNKLLAYKGDSLLWEKNMIGTGIYPPSVADINGDGQVEIIQVTGGNGRKGRIYVTDAFGNNISGFPKNYSDHWILTAPALADLDEDGNLEIIFLERNAPGGFVHILNHEGTPFSADWPIRLPGTPAVTPSIGDIDNDGQKDIIIASTTVLYAFDLEGNLKEGWPVEDSDTKFSFQSPILADLDQDNDLEIIGATHGNIPQYYVLQHDGSPYKFWPFFVPEQEWTYSTPSIIEVDGVTQILMSRPAKSEQQDMLYSWNEAGDLQNGFPIEKEGGLEGIISVANIDEDADMELIFGSNRLDASGFGFIHAFNMDGSGEVEGFPLRPKGWTLMNGAALGDINNDGKMDLTALSYTANFGAAVRDSVFLNVYNLDVPYNKGKILWNTYKGSNTRDGNRAAAVISALPNIKIEGLKFKIHPNPIRSNGQLILDVQQNMHLTGQILTADGKQISPLFSSAFSKGIHHFKLPNLSSGVYFIHIKDQAQGQLIQKIISK